MLRRGAATRLLGRGTRLLDAVVHRPAFASLWCLGQSTAEDVGMGIRARIERRKGQEQREDAEAREGERHVVAKDATAMVASRRRSVRSFSGVIVAGQHWSFLLGGGRGAPLRRHRGSHADTASSAAAARCGLPYGEAC
jgi:hypothetical protein